MSTETLSYKTVKTRKEHRCSLCGLRIRNGAKAHYWAGVYDGDFQSGYAHGYCQRLWVLLDEDELLDQGDFRRDVLGLPLLKGTK